MKLIDFICLHYSGVMLQFAKANKKTRQQFEQNVKSDNFHVIRIDGVLKLVQEKMTIVEPITGDEKNVEKN